MFRIVNWSSFQSYKDRRPPWIRFHKTYLDNYEFQKMSADARALLPMLWLLASEDEDPVSGSLRIGYEEIAFRLRLPDTTVKTALDECIRKGFVERVDPENELFFDKKSSGYKTVTDGVRNRHETVPPETETETETETPLAPLQRGVQTSKGTPKNDRPRRLTVRQRQERALDEAEAAIAADRRNTE